jgi:hypothetical protein
MGLVQASTYRSFISKINITSMGSFQFFHSVADCSTWSCLQEVQLRVFISQITHISLKKFPAFKVRKWSCFGSNKVKNEPIRQIAGSIVGVAIAVRSCISA